MEREQLLRKAQETDDYHQRLRLLTEQAGRNEQIYNAMLAEIRHFIRATHGVNPQKLDKNVKAIDSARIVIEKGITLPELGKGYVVGKVDHQSSDPWAYSFALDKISAFGLFYYFAPQLSSAGSAKQKLIAREYFSDAYNRGPLPYEGFPILSIPDEWSEEEKAELEENTTKLDTMVARTANSLTLLIDSAMDPQLNPAIAPKVLEYYEALALQDGIEPVNIGKQSLSSEASESS